MNAGQMMTWEDFKLKFSKYHVPQGLIKKMRDEFRELKKGRMSVVEYRDRFLTLSSHTDGRKAASANENRKRRMMNQSGPHHTQKYRNNSSGGFTPRHNKPPLVVIAPTTTTTNGGPPKPGGNNNNSHHNNNNHNSNNNNNTNTGPRTGSNAIPVTPKDKSTVNCYECGVVGHYSNECPKKLANIAANTAAPAQQQRRFAGRRNQNNNNGRLYHMTATEAQEAPRPCQLAYTLLLTPVHFPAKGSHGIGHQTLTQTRQKRARHAVSVHHHHPGRARARRRLDAVVLPFPSSCACTLHTMPGPRQTPPLAVAGAVDDAIIKPCRAGTARTAMTPHAPVLP
ncbi:hypothetical protein QYE76_036869 [Lolium multiflorum]|uniref:CCHC-type domain-containing protein n=1 Tax=Lolium multiflorum TaxID=4521 RepID=A0AAD8R3A7_LOLMU|nr:hypothetical protein QYE76_036869 [Lolium multiflorum]